MKCFEFTDRMNSLLDDRQLPQVDGLLRAHASICEGCRETLAAQEILFTGLELFDPPALPPNFVSNVMSAVARPEDVVSKAEVTGHNGWRVGLFAAVVATAAVALIAVSLAWNQRRDENAETEIAVIQPARPGKLRHNGPLLSAHNPGQIAKALPQTVNRDEDVLSPARVREYREALHLFALHLPDAVGQLEAVEFYAPGIRPVRASFSVALDALYRTIPGNRDHRPGTPQAGNSILSATSVA